MQNTLLIASLGAIASQAIATEAETETEWGCSGGMGGAIGSLQSQLADLAHKKDHQVKNIKAVHEFQACECRNAAAENAVADTNNFCLDANRDGKCDTDKDNFCLDTNRDGKCDTKNVGCLIDTNGDGHPDCADGNCNGLCDSKSHYPSIDPYYAHYGSDYYHHRAPVPSYHYSDRSYFPGRDSYYGGIGEDHRGYSGVDHFDSGFDHIHTNGYDSPYGSDYGHSSSLYGRSPASSSKGPSYGYNSSYGRQYSTSSPSRISSSSRLGYRSPYSSSSYSKVSASPLYRQSEYPYEGSRSYHASSSYNKPPTSVYRHEVSYSSPYGQKRSYSSASSSSRISGPYSTGYGYGSYSYGGPRYTTVTKKNYIKAPVVKKEECKLNLPTW